VDLGRTLVRGTENVFSHLAIFRGPPLGNPSSSLHSQHFCTLTPVAVAHAARRIMLVRFLTLFAAQTSLELRGSTTFRRRRHRTRRSVLRTRNGSARMRLSHPLSSGSQLRPVFDFRARFCHSRPMETHAFGFRLRADVRSAKSDFLSAHGVHLLGGGVAALPP
jgi:hypothetical protein